MSFVIDLSCEIEAPLATVWDVITDLSAYGEWNPFVVACRSTLVAGDPIVMQVRLFAWFTQSQRERIFEHVPHDHLCYGLDGGSVGAVVSRRCHELHAIGAERTRYRSHFEMSGWLAPLVRAMLGSRLEHGFRSMTDAIRQRAERLQRA
jgi:hypothetical protein